MTIDELLDVMDETLEEGASVPFTGGKRMVDVEKIRDIIDDIRLNMPGEIRQAKNIVQDRQSIIDTATKEAEGIVKRAEERARAIVSQEAVVKAAGERANEIATQAQTRSRELRNKTVDFCEAMLRDTEEQLVKSAAEVKDVRAKLRQTGKGVKATARRVE